MGSGGQARPGKQQRASNPTRHTDPRAAKMADGGWDPCECIFNHEMAMRRLLPLLRNSQSTCTDNECFTDGLPGPNTTDGNADPSGGFIMMSMAWMVMAMMMYFMRPNSLRGEPQGKPQGPPGGGNQDPRDPPAVS